MNNNYMEHRNTADGRTSFCGSMQDGVSRKRRVLIADHNADAAESFARLLALDGHDAAFTNDGIKALRLFSTMRPDVVMLDTHMPGISGHDIARRIRADIPDAGVLLIAVTGWARPADRHQSYMAGFDYHLVKPVEYEQLAAILAAGRRRWHVVRSQ